MPAASAPVLLTAPGGYRIDARSILVDVVEFESACKAGAAEEARDAREAAIESYGRAASLYRGDFLADDRYADRALEERERLRALSLDALERLAALYLAAGQAPVLSAPVRFHVALLNGGQPVGTLPSQGDLLWDGRGRPHR